MMQHLGTIDQTMTGLNFLAGKNRPFVQFMTKHWWIVAIAGFAMYSKVTERHKKNDLTVYNTLTDLGLVLSPLVGLAMLNQLAAQDIELKTLLSRNVQPGMPIPPAPGT